MRAEQLERRIRGDALAGHENPLRLLDHGPPAECTLQALIFGEALQRDVDRACELLRVVVEDVREDAALRSFMDVGGVLRRQQRDHRAGGLADDLADQVECVL
jgi:hypothetical protein